jgi:hypothetical protein
MPEKTTNFKLIHVGRIDGPNHKKTYLFLRQVAPSQYMWFQESKPGDERPMGLSASSVESAIQLAQQKWNRDSFSTLKCGWRYTLPERDEHGLNALFHQMVAAYSVPNGVYFDPEAGHSCSVHFASQEALDLWHRLAQAGSL